MARYLADVHPRSAPGRAAVARAAPLPYPDLLTYGPLDRSEPRERGCFHGAMVLATGLDRQALRKLMPVHHLSLGAAKDVQAGQLVDRYLGDTQ